MVLQKPWLDLILGGSKTMELRGRKFRLGYVWLGESGLIHGRVKIVEAVSLTPEQFRAREEEHRWPADAEIPYKQPCGLILSHVQKLQTPLPYWRPGSAIGWNVYREKPEDLPLKTSDSNKRKKQDPKHDRQAQD